jgi:hypothetical protein
MYVCVCMYAHVCMHMYVCTCMYVCMYVHVCMSHQRCGIHTHTHTHKQIDYSTMNHIRCGTEDFNENIISEVSEGQLGSGLEDDLEGGGVVHQEDALASQ